METGVHQVQSGWRGRYWRRWLGSPLHPFLITLIFSLLISPGSARTPPGEEADPAYWTRWAQQELEEALSRRPNERLAKNVILFIGDGMSLSTVTAARIYKGQLKGKNGEEEILVFEKFPNLALAKTYNVDHQVPDSAATATAFLCGVKANYGTLGLNARAPRGNCARSKGNNVTCLAEMAQKAGKATGIVSTGRLSHATPAPLYSFSPDRMWEDDSLLPPKAYSEGCRDIASQIVGEVGLNLNVVMGGGRKNLLPATEADPEHAQLKGRRWDGRNLINEWMSHKEALGKERAKYVWNKVQFDQVDPDTTDHLLGVFEHSHMLFEGDREKDPDNEPSLPDMVEKAIRILKKNPNGFFLLVEGARIDHGHHENTARRALEETIMLEEAVRRARQLLGSDDTLMVVTADHSHPLAISSYAKRGNPILGLTDFASDMTGRGMSDVDGLPFTSLSYANGPGYVHSPRPNLTGTDTESRHYRQATAVPTLIVSHEGSDVPIYADGPMAHLFHSTHEQHYIFHVISHAACLHENKHHPHCSRALKSKDECGAGYITSNGGRNRVYSYILFINIWMWLLEFR